MARTWEGNLSAAGLGFASCRTGADHGTRPTTDRGITVNRRQSWQCRWHRPRPGLENKRERVIKARADYL